MKYSCRILHAGMNLIEVLKKKCYCIFNVFFSRNSPTWTGKSSGFWVSWVILFFFFFFVFFFSSVLQLTLISVFYTASNASFNTVICHLKTSGIHTVKGSSTDPAHSQVIKSQWCTMQHFSCWQLTALSEQSWLKSFCCPGEIRTWYSQIPASLIIFILINIY